MPKKRHFKRHRRLRAPKAIRQLIRETKLDIDDLIYPMFAIEGEHIEQAVPLMPGISHVSLDLLLEEIEAVDELGIQAVMLFGIAAAKADMGSGVYAEERIIQR